MSLNIGILVFPKVEELDFVGPNEVFGLARPQGAEVHQVWKTTAPLTSATGLRFLPSTNFEDCPRLDVICVPGGPGARELLGDQQVLDFIRTQAATARYITSVCTGSLVLGAAGLLKNKRATTHWHWLDALAQYGAIATNERVVRDGNLITAGGVTAGIDFGLTIIGELFGAELGEIMQLALEYAPAPPYKAGRPQDASPELLEATRNALSASR